MRSARIEKLRQLADRKPEDPFPLYALALECRKLELEQEAEEAFAALLMDHPEYVPSYFHYGQMLIELDRPEEAGTVLRQGLAAAARQGDAKAAAEISALLEELN